MGREKVEVEVRLDAKTVAHVDAIAKLAGVKRDTVLNVLLAQHIILAEQHVKSKG